MFQFTFTILAPFICLAYWNIGTAIRLNKRQRFTKPNLLQINSTEMTCLTELKKITQNPSPNSKGSIVAQHHGSPVSFDEIILENASINSPTKKDKESCINKQSLTEELLIKFKGQNHKSEENLKSMPVEQPLRKVFSQNSVPTQNENLNFFPPNHNKVFHIIENNVSTLEPYGSSQKVQTLRSKSFEDSATFFKEVFWKNCNQQQRHAMFLSSKDIESKVKAVPADKINILASLDLASCVVKTSQHSSSEGLLNHQMSVQTRQIDLETISVLEDSPSPQTNSIPTGANLQQKTLTSTSFRLTNTSKETSQTR